MIAIFFRHLVHFSFRNRVILHFANRGKQRRDNGRGFANIRPASTTRPAALHAAPRRRRSLANVSANASPKRATSASLEAQPRLRRIAPAASPREQLTRRRSHLARRLRNGFVELHALWARPPPRFAPSRGLQHSSKHVRGPWADQANSPAYSSLQSIAMFQARLVFPRLRQ